MSSLRENHEKCSEERSQVSVSRISIVVDSDEYPDVPLPTKRLPTQEDEDKLCEVFPSKKETVRAALVAVDGDLERAAAMLAEESGNCVDDDKDDLLNKPVLNEVPVVSDEFETPETIQPLSATEALRKYRSQSERGTQFIDFNRMQMSSLRQLMRIYKQPDLNLKKHLDVSFSGECGADMHMGGPSKEFFHVSLASLKKVDPVYNFQLFTGEKGHLVPVYGADLLSSGCFQMAGKLLAHSILHGGDALVGLAPPIKEYMVSGSVEEAGKLVTTSDLPDVELRTLLEEKVIGKEFDLTDGEKDKLEELMVRHGLTMWVPLTSLNIGAAVQDLMIAEVLSTRIQPLQSLFKGMNRLGLGDLLRENPDLVKKVFPSAKDVLIDVDLMTKKIKLDVLEKVDSEEKQQAWQWFLQFVKESDSLEDPDSKEPLVNQLMTFLSGRPTLNDVDEIEVKFLEDPKKLLLEAGACFNTISLPLAHQTYKDFKKYCLTSLFFGGKGYGRF
ncbi:uncharacterized protein LOC144653970 [Oculina patagonica]